MLLFSVAVRGCLTMMTTTTTTTTSCLAFVIHSTLREFTFDPTTGCDIQILVTVAIPYNSFVSTFWCFVSFRLGRFGSLVRWFVRGLGQTKEVEQQNKTRDIRGRAGVFRQHGTQHAAQTGEAQSERTTATPSTRCSEVHGKIDHAVRELLFCWCIVQQ